MFVTGRPRRYLQIDGLVLFIAMIVLFAATHQHWWIFPVLLFVPDVFILGYLKNPRLGAFLYNVGHSYLAPTVTIFVGWRASSLLTMAIGIIWLGHVGLDRFLGYGLKYDDNFKTTHLGNLSKAKTSPEAL